MTPAAQVALGSLGGLAAVVGLAAGAAVLIKPTERKQGLLSALETAVLTAILMLVLGAVPAAASWALSGLLVANQASAATYLVIAALCALAVSVNFQAHYNGTAECGRFLACAFAAYGVIWALVAVIVLGGAALPAQDVLLTVIRPLVAAAPFAALGFARARRRRVRSALAMELACAAFCAIVFLPVERGWAAAYLPVSDWLRFPLAGLAAAVALVAAPTLAGGVLRATKRAGRIRERLRDGAFAGLLFGACAVLLGLAWALTRLGASLL
jgi:hypothetical protein